MQINNYSCKLSVVFQCLPRKVHVTMQTAINGCNKVFSKNATKKTAACALSTHGLLKGIVADRLNTGENCRFAACAYLATAPGHAEMKLNYL